MDTSFLNNTANRVGSSVNNKLGKKLNELTGLASADIPLYEDFLYKILADANNAVTEPSYWVVFFGNPVATTSRGIGGYISNQFGVEGDTKFDDVAFDGPPLDVTKWKQGKKTAEAQDQFLNNMTSTMMLVQGVDIPGDGFALERGGAFNVGGFLKPAMTGNRNQTPEMGITFLENNASVTDLVLRPWVIETSYRSLKFATKTTINCFNLTRSPSGFRIRKRFTFFNAVPISIDSEKYEYKGGSGYGKRQIKFVFTHYALDEGDEMKDELVSAVGNLVGQKLRSKITQVVESGVDVVAGTAGNITTNIVGEFSQAVNDHIQDAQSRMREYAKNAEDSIIDNASREIDDIVGTSSDDRVKTSLELDNFVENVYVKEDHVPVKPQPVRNSVVENNVSYDIVDITPYNNVKLEDTLANVDVVPDKEGIIDGFVNGVKDKATGIVENVIESGVEIVKGGFKVVKTNVVGAVEGAIDDQIGNVQSQVREYAKNAEASIIDKVNQVVDSAIGLDSAKDIINRGKASLSTDGVDNLSAPRIEVTSNVDDILSLGAVQYTIRTIETVDVPDTSALNLQVVNIGSEDIGVDNGVNTTVTSNSNDTVDTTSLPLSNVVAGSDDISLNSINSQNVVVGIDDISINSIDSQNVSAGNADTPDSGALPTVNIVAGNDDTANSGSLPTTNVVAGSDDTSNGTGLPTTNVVAGSDDTSNGTGLPTTNVVAGSDDTVNSGALPTTNVVAGNDDTSNGTGLPTTNVVAGNDDTSNGTGLPTTNVVAGNDDTANSGALPTTNIVAGNDDT